LTKIYLVFHEAFSNSINKIKITVYKCIFIVGT
jgi:hypothetical protein